MKVLAAVLFVPATFFWQMAVLPMALPGTVDGGVRFSHRLHMEDAGTACADCHEPAAESTTGADNLLPDHDVCSACHEVEEPDECGTCHTNADDPEGLVYITGYSALFPHATHLEGGFECVDCHAGIEAAEPDDEVALPGMAQCVDCHNEEVASVECRTCHEPGDDLMPATHVVGFARTHGAQAAQNAISAHGDLTCQTCHDDVFCQDCHEGENLDRLSHPLNYEFTHALDVQSGAVNCTTCHTESAFCVDCHAENRLMPQTHTAGWVNALDGGRHRIEALNDLDTCIACHEDDAEITCGGCHVD
jgi:hypothetical protein